LKADHIKAMLACLNSKVEYKQRRTGWVVATCPFAPWLHSGGRDRNASFGVALPQTARKQMYTCFSCGSVGRIESLPFDVREHLRKSKREGYAIGKAIAVLAADEDEPIEIDLPDYDEPIPDPGEVIVWPEFFLESFKSVFSSEAALAYLGTRQITHTEISYLDLRYDTQRQRVCFPIRDFDGKLVGLHGRHISDHPMRYYAYGYEDRRNKLPWLGEQWVDFDEPVLLVESVFDLASVLRVYPNSMCALSSGMSEDKIKRIDQGVLFVTLFDLGTGGDHARESLTEHLRTAHHHITPPKEDPGEMDVDALVSTLGAYLSLTKP
jgi:hypothetical protein